MLKKITYLVLCTLLSVFIASCSDESIAYKNDGFTFEPAPDWVFTSDEQPSIFGGRQIIFAFGEHSTVNVFIREKTTSLEDFSNFLLAKTLLADKSAPTTIISDTPRSFDGLSGRHLKIQYKLFTETTTDATFLAYTYPNESIFLVSLEV